MTEKKISGPIPDGPESSLSFERCARERYLPFAREHKRSWKTDGRYLERHVLPYLGASALADISEETLKDWMTRLEASGMSPSSCCRIFWPVKDIRNCAVCRHVLPDGETFRNAAFPGEKQRRMLSPEEACTFTRLPEKYGIRPSAQAIHLLLRTCTAKSEILHARRENVSLRYGILAASSTCTECSRLIPLNNGAMKRICNLPEYKNVPSPFSSANGNRSASLHLYTKPSAQKQTADRNCAASWTLPA